MFVHPYIAQALADAHIQQLRRTTGPRARRRQLDPRPTHLATRLALVLEPATRAPRQPTACPTC